MKGVRSPLPCNFAFEGQSSFAQLLEAKYRQGLIHASLLAYSFLFWVTPPVVRFADSFPGQRRRPHTPPLSPFHAA